MEIFADLLTIAIYFWTSRANNCLAILNLSKLLYRVTQNRKKLKIFRSLLLQIQKIRNHILCMRGNLSCIGIALITIWRLIGAVDLSKIKNHNLSSAVLNARHRNLFKLEVGLQEFLKIYSTQNSIY